MKKIMTLLTVLFAIVAMTFGQPTIENTTFYLNNGTNLQTDGFTIGVDPTYPGVVVAKGVMTILFDTPLDFVSVDNDKIGVTNLTTKQLPNGAVYAVTFDYEDMMSGDVIINCNTNTEFSDLFLQTDIDEAFNNGVTIGVESVNVDSIYQSGYNDGTEDLNIIESNIEDIIENYLTTNSINGSIVDNFLTIGPNPVEVGHTVTVNSSETDIDITVYNVAGQVQSINSFGNTFSTDNLTSGMYIVLIKKGDKIITNSDNDTFKLIVR